MKTPMYLLILPLLILISSCESGIKQQNIVFGPETIDIESLPAHMTPELMWQLGRLSDIQLSPDEQTLLFGIHYYNSDSNTGIRSLYTIPAEGGEMTKITTEEMGSVFNGTWRPDGKRIGYIAAKTGSPQAWEINIDGSNASQLTNIEDGINGFKYAPNLKHILYTKDVSLDKKATDIHKDLPKANARIIDELMYRHWNQWHDFAYSHVFYAAYSENSMITEGTDIMKGEKFDTPMKPWGGMEQITWSPDGDKIAYTCKKLRGKDYTLSTNSEIYLYNLNNNKTQNISSKGFEGYDQDPVFSPNGDRIAWKSMEEDGFEADKERMMVMDLSNNTVVELTKNFDQNAALYQFSTDGKTIYFISGVHATYQLYSVNVETNEIKQITTGDHNYTSFIAAEDFIVGTKMNMNMPVEIFRINKTDGKETQISFVNKKIYDNIKVPTIEKRWITTTDNKQMLTWVIYPPDFDPNKKYPTLLYCQGGPQSAVSQFFSYRWNFQIMASMGYIVVAPNRRGLPTFGQEWNDQISGDYGGQNMLDYFSAIDTLAAEPYVDENKLGAIGASYGGFSVFWIAGNHDKRFKALISHCGIYNFESMYGSTEEYFFVNKDYEGPYWNDPKPKSYEFSPHLFVQKWDTPILIITGEHDYRIPYTQSLEAFNAAQLLGVESKLLFFPDETHFILKPQNAILWQREFFSWLDKHLK